MKLIDWIKGKFIKQENIATPYHDLAPVDDIGEESEYFHALDWALHNIKISNVALSAPYGAGKSSVIESYLKARDIKALQLSLANFKETQHDVGSDEVEKEFLKKLFYKVDYKKIPQSRYRKLHKISLKKIYGVVTLLAAIILSFFVAFDLPKVKKVIDKLNVAKTELRLSNVVGILLLIVLAVVSIWIISLALKWTFSKWKNWEISFFDKAKVSTEDDSDKSIFNRYLDEIVYFFEETDFEVVFIEDLDRFKATGIFTKLRELNLLLNRYESIKRHITFVYAIRDDYFPSDTDRTKFFDYIIPIIPYINATNSDDLLRRRIGEINRNGICTDISDEYITKVSSYIGDMRVLTSIVNEFITYKKTVKKDNSLSLKDEELFSLMVFKNLYPSDFADIESEKGIIKEAFKCKDRFISEKKTALENYISEAENTLELHENDILKDSYEIKQALFQAILPNLSIQNVTINNGGRRYSYDQIMAPEFDMSLFENEKFTIHGLNQNGGSATKHVTNVESEYNKNGAGYIKRWKAAFDCEDDRIDELRKNIEKKKNEVYGLKATRIQKLIEDYGAETVFAVQRDILDNQLLIFMLRNGYIDETYVNYINYYHPDSITPDEHEFILNLRNYGGVKDLAQELVHPDRVVDRLVAHEFRQIEILNFSLVKYLVDEKSDSVKTEELFALLSSRQPESIEFIQRYMQSETSTVSGFIEKLANYNSYLWKDIECDETIPDEAKMHYFDLVMKNATIAAIVEMEKADSCVSRYLLGREHVLTDFNECSINKIIEILKALDIRFKNTSLDGIDSELMDYIYENNLYDINQYMLGEIIKRISPELYDKSKLQNYSVISSLDDRGILDYVDENIDVYVRNIVLCGDNCEETQEAIEDIFEMIAFDIQMCTDIISKQNTSFKSLKRLADDIDEDNKEAIHEIIDTLIAKDKLDINWDVIATYYGAFEITEDIFEKIVYSLDQLSEDSTEVDDEVVKALLVGEWPQDKYKQFASNYKIDNFDIGLSELSESNLRVLLDLCYVPFSLELIESVSETFSDLLLLLFERYKEDIIAILEAIPSTYIPFDGIMKSSIYNDAERLLFVKKCNVAELTEGIALFIMNHEGEVDKPYILAAWDILPEEKRYELLLNHIEVFENKELPALFNQLAPVYHSLALRTNHKANFEKTAYNQRLLNKLKQKKYITSLGTEEVPDESKKHRFFGDKKTMLFCRVRAVKDKTIKGN